MLIDTAASLCVLKQGLIDSTKYIETREEQVSTSAGVIATKVYKEKVILFEIEFETEFILAQIDDSLAFNM